MGGGSGLNGLYTLSPLDDGEGIIFDNTGLEFTKKFCFSFGKVGQRFTSPNIFKLFQIILATNELLNDLKSDNILLAFLVQVIPLFKFCKN